MVSLKHKFTSLIPDAGDPTIVQPSNWNDEHDLTQATGAILGRVTAGPGSTEELTPAQVRTLINVANGATANSSDAFLLSRANHTGTQSADTLTDGTTNKAFLATERTKLAGIATGATANSSDAFLLARANHTGTQLAATISDFSTAADARISAAIGVTVQAYSANLASWAGVTRAAGFDTFAATPSSANLRALLSDEVGTGAAYFVGGALGTPASGTATNLTGLPVSTGISGLGTGVATFLATPSSANLRAALTDEVGTGAAYFVGGALGTPASGTLTNATGLPVSTGISGFASNMAAFLAGGTSTQLAAALTDGTGTGACVFAGSPTLTGAPVIAAAVGDSIAVGGGVLPANTKIQGYASSNSLQIIERLENDNGSSPIAALGFVVTNSGGETRSAKAGFGLERNSANGRGHVHFYNRLTNDTSDFTSADVYARANISGQFDIVRCFGRGSPIVKTADFTVAITENWLINNKAAANCTVTLPAASSFPGREIMLTNRQAFTVISASSNVVPLAGGAAGTAILAATAGRWATLVSDGTNWLILQAA
ncbi:hypothetical protein LJR234_004629 [Mesorhizobium amorphae]|uniref:hypothetical protein n=1 Tax=Mesorhizobium amorphae TaxID=71433 RepID=UPI003ECDC82A